jgi:8-oxo-dGTP pyrophosphatase MutT (NUDIX family)
MHRQPLLAMLDRYAARYPAEGAVAARIRALVSAHPDCFERTCRPGHITASAWVTTPERDRFLLVHHRKLNRWLQPGGHMDGHGDVAAAALREVQEETGLADVRLATVDHVDAGAPCNAGGTPLDLDVHVIPARYDAGQLIEDAHEHHDVRVLAIAHGDLTPQVSDESHAVRWFTAEELQAITDEESVLRLWRKSGGMTNPRKSNDE